MSLGGAPSSKVKEVESFAKQLLLSVVVSLAVIVIWQSGNQLFPSRDFSAHGMCYQWYRPMVVLQFSSDMLIFLAYLAIPAALIYLLRKNPDVPYRGAFWGGGLFVLFCGFTHLMEAVEIWHPWYWLGLATKVITVAASVPTALYLAHIIPQAIAVRELHERTRTVVREAGNVSYSTLLSQLRELDMLLELEERNGRR